MKKTILLIIILFNMLLYLSCEEVKKKFIENLKQSIYNSNKNNIELKALTNFEWDFVYIFIPYTNIKKINKTLGFNWQKAKKINLNSRDDINLLVFIKGNKVIKYIEVPRNYGDFSKININNGLSPQRAIFKINIINNWPYLELVE